MSLRSDEDKIIEESLHAVLPDQAVKRALKNYAAGEGRIALIAAGKAAWQLANAARSALGDACTGLVIMKYGHVRAWNRHGCSAAREQHVPCTEADRRAYYDRADRNKCQ